MFGDNDSFEGLGERFDYDIIQLLLLMAFGGCVVRGWGDYLLY